MTQTIRPIQIDEILKTIASEYSSDMVTSLEAYLSDLEARPQVTATRNKVTQERVWSHSRVIKREQHRRERALQKLKDFQ
ncbi:MAG: hypothetical protein K8L99_26885 [Anaerolineae bacterium]|nr:hypothetical protein [Anaerolineae bacterium]